MEVHSPGNADGLPDPKVVEVQEALESLLSKKSLVRDQSLAGNMNPQMYISIMILLAHEKLQAIGATEATVVAAAVRSTKLAIDEMQMMVRPLLKSKRNVVILREVPEGTTESDIFELFVGAPHADRIVHVKPEVNNTWFVKFNLEDGTADVVLWLRSQFIKGQPVNAAIKSEHFLRSFYPLPQHSMGQQQMQGQPQMGFAPTGQQMPDQMVDMMDQRPAPEMFGVGMPMPMQMPPPPPPLQEGMQTAGYWQPWGQRYQPPPLIFTSSTTLAASSMPEPGEQVPPLDFLEDFEEAEGGAGGKGKGKGGDYKGGGKGKWNSGKNSGKDWSSGGGRGWQSGKDWSSGKDGGSKGWDGGSKGWHGGGGKDWNAGGKGWQASGQDWNGGGQGGGQDWYAGGGRGYAGGRGKGGKSPLDMYDGGGGGGEGYSGQGAGNWFAASQGGEHWPAPAGGKQQPKGRKGGKGEKGGDFVAAGSGEGGKKGQKGGGGASQAQAPSGHKYGTQGTTYQHEVRKYSRQDFERIRQAVNQESLTCPEALAEALAGAEIPVLLEAPVLEPIAT